MTDTEREPLDADLLRQARDELRIWLRQMQGIMPRNATTDSMRIEPLILALDERLRPSCTAEAATALVDDWERHSVELIRDSAERFRLLSRLKVKQ